LARIESRYEHEPVVVVGVHSAKFLSEKDPENIRHAIRRHGVSHPVVVDSEHDIWQRFGVHSWPTLVLVDASGRIRETIAGEVGYEELAAKIDALLEEGRRSGILTAASPDWIADPEDEPTFLRFPGKLHVAAERLYISDSGHNRIVVATLDGRVEAIVGEGGVGGHDGAASAASFHNPQGLSRVGARLYVADAGNHLLRAVDLSGFGVETIAGTGEKGRGAAAFDPRNPRGVALRSPWGLVAVGEQLLVAMAGSHQIWVFDPTQPALAPWAGSGREDHVDGALAEAAFAQPSGLARAGRYVFVADSEVSSVRAIDLSDGMVRTIVGRGLFDFGDHDGDPGNVLLQHPLDVAVSGSVLYVADSDNNKIKAITFGTMETRTVLGDGSPGTMHEPGGIAVAGDCVLVADTNNHRILRGYPSTGRLEELQLRTT
jgi:hypothetical protein